MPAGEPSGLWMTSPDEGDEPSFVAVAASEKYSMLSERPYGDEGATLAVSTPSFGDLADRSELVRQLAVDRPPGDRGAPFADQSGDIGWKLGLTGEVAMGAKNGSTMGFVTAVCNAVRMRRGPAGLGTTITSGSRVHMLPGVIMDWIASFTSLKFANDV